MDSKLLDEKNLLEVLELAKVGEQKMKEVSEGLTQLTVKCEKWY